MFASFWAYSAAKRISLVVVYISLLGVITTGFAAALGALASSIVVSAPDGFGDACRLILPSNTGLCVSAIVSARLIRFAYIWGIELLDKKMNYSN